MARSRRFKTLKISRRRKRKKTNFLNKFLIFFLVFLLVLVIPAIAGYIWFKRNILDKLPDVSNIEKIQFAQTTVITDRNGKVLYKLFQQNRKYIYYKDISPNLINAIVATEDKNFWTNPGIDISGLIRAAIHDITHPGGPKQGGSTITQQLIKNLLLTPEKTITRKLKEIVLAIKLDDYLKQKEKKLNPNLSGQELDRKIKEKILELYLNYIFLGNNSRGIEAASETYFHKHAKDLNILESSIIAALPKAPSYYDPVKYPWRNIGSIKICNLSGCIKVSLPNKKVYSTGYIGLSSTDINKIYDLFVQQVKSKLKDVTFTFKKDENDIIDFIKGLLSLRIDYKGKTYDVSYIPGRKDIVLARMFVDGYINSKQLKQAIINGFTIKIYEPILQIKAPHFVFFVLNYLKKKYGEDLLLKGGLTIKTTLDLNIQSLAEKAIRDNLSHLHKYGANNAALIYVDSKNGDILAYVGSVDYNSGAIDGKVDMIQSLRQPGSTIKPFVYALAFKKFPYTIDQPIYDTKVKFGNYEPSDVDGKFLGLMPLREALPYSRNIPAIKLLYIEGLRNFVNFIHSLGVKNISLEKISNYGLSLAIGAAEVRMYNWAQAFAHLSALGKPAKLNPILEIRGPDGTLIYKKQIEKLPQIIPSGVAYLIWKILSTKTNFPPSWRYTYTYGKGIVFATKSGTTNVKLKNGKKLPRDGWFVAYTPSKVMVFWAGNTKGEPMKWNAYGGWLNSPIWKEFVDLLKERGYIKNEKMPDVETKSLAVSKLSGKLPSFDTPLKLIVSSVGWIGNLPSLEDDSIKKIKVDKLCNGKVSKYTPKDDIIDAYVIKPEDVISAEDDPENYANVIKWWQTKGKEIYSKILNAPVFILNGPENICEERLIVAKYGKIKINLIKPLSGQQIAYKFNLWYNIKSPFKIKQVEIYLGKLLLKSLQYNSEQVGDIVTLKIPSYIKDKAILKLIALDEKGYKDEKDVLLKLTNEDVDKPYIYKKTYSKIDGKYKVNIIFMDKTSGIKGGSILKDGKIVKKFDGNFVSFIVDNLNGLNYEVKDFYGNIAEGEIGF